MKYVIREKDSNWNQDEQMNINDIKNGISYMANKSRIEIIKECKKKIKLYNMKEISKRYLSLYNNV